MGIGKFQKNAKPSAAPAPSGFKRGAAAPAARPPAKTRSRFAGINSGSDRTPMLDVGEYLLRVGPCSDEPSKKDKRNSWFGADVVVEGAAEGAGTPEGAKRKVLFCSSTDAGQNELFRFIRTSAGFEDDSAFEEALQSTGFASDDEQAGAEFVEAVVGETNGFAENSPSQTGNPIEARLVHVIVTRGKDDGKGGWYREYQWSPVDESEQDQTVRIDAERT